MPGKVSVIIPVHNSLDYTKKALHDLARSIDMARQSGWHFPIVLVDDGSQDGTTDWVSKHYPEVHLCHGDGNLWWSGAMNLGMQYAIETLGAGYVLWWNNDIYPAEDYFLNLVELLNTGNSDTVFGSKIYIAVKPGHIWSFGGIFHSVWGHSFMPGMNKEDGKDFQQPREVDWLAGMGTVLPAAVIKKTGWLNSKEFPQYHGDIDYTYRAKRGGFKIEVRPELRIWNDTTHSGMVPGSSLPGLLSSLRKINSVHNFKKEWLLYRKYAKTPLAFLMLLKKFSGQFIKMMFRGRGEDRG